MKSVLLDLPDAAGGTPALPFLLVVGDYGVVLDCTAIRAGAASWKQKAVAFTFHIENGKMMADALIYRPIKPVVISPGENVFTDTMKVTLACATAGVDIRYTLDGSRPTPKSARYTAPFTVNATCRLKTRAFRKGVTEDIWQQDGTHATVIYSAVYRKEAPAPAIAPRQTLPGLKYEYYEGVWTELLVRSLTIPAKSTGTVSKLMDVSARKTDGAFGLRYEGYLDVPADGTYTFHTPREYCFPDVDCGYDLRVFVDGREWNPAVRWQGHGTWSVALGKGRHAFKVVFTDLRLRPHKVELMWGYPHPDFTWKGLAPRLELSGPGVPKAPIPDAWLSRAL